MTILLIRRLNSTTLSYNPVIRSSANFSTSSKRLNRDYKVVIVGAGSGGLPIAAKLSKRLSPKCIALVDPANVHYYQPMFTLVGGGMKKLSDSARPMSSLIPKGMRWFQEKAVNIQPENQIVRLGNGEILKYDFLVLACGIQLQYEKIKGLPKAFEYPEVCSNYSPLYVEKTYEALKNFKGGNAIFTFPNTPVKCAGAPQKILYISEEYFRKNGQRENANMIYNTSLNVLFGVKKYADSLWDVVKSRDIQVNLRTNLIEVIPKEKKAIFENLDDPSKTITYDYGMLHITPPMGPNSMMRKASVDLCNEDGYLKVDKESLQHEKYPNVFGLGDCTNIPTAKTAAAIAAQSGILSHNLMNVINGKEAEKIYDGYTSCPLVTGYKKCIFAEFDFTGQPLETFPFDQSKERRTMFHMKKDVMPKVYWNLMINGKWNGPAGVRKVMHLGMK